MSNRVQLDFEADTRNAEAGFDRVGASSQHMSEKVGESGAGFDKAGEAADGAEGKAQGFSDTLTGVSDIAGGTGAIMKGNLFEGFVQVGQGAADLAGGLASFLIPALKASKVGTLAKAAADKVAAGAAKVWAGAQWLMNSALLASPITWIVIAIVALIAIIVLIATKTNWFQKIWKAAWGGIKSAASNVWEWLKKLPGWISSAFSSIANYIADPFKQAFNAISRAWNNTIGQLSWSVPGWVPGIGGNSISVPNLPTFHAGGTVPGVVGTPTMALLQAGEKVSSIAGSSGDGGGWVAVRGDSLIDALTQAIARRVDAKGGRAAQLGIRFS